MPRVKIGPALPDREKLDAEIARLRDLDVGQLRSRWHTAFGRPAPAHLARHLLFRSLAYRLQADRLGDLGGESQRLLDRSGSPEKAGRNAVDLSRQTTELRPGTILGREWNGQAAWQAIRGPGPLRAFYKRVARRRGTHVAAVAVARKLAVIIWHLLTRE